MTFCQYIMHKQNNKDQLSLTSTRDALHYGVLQTSQVDAQYDRTMLTTLRVESRQFAATAPAFNLPHMHLAPPLG